jgi:hypothetical protein
MEYPLLAAAAEVKHKKNSGHLARFAAMNFSQNPKWKDKGRVKKRGTDPFLPHSIHLFLDCSSFCTLFSTMNNARS